MKIKFILIALCILFSFSFINAAMDPVPPFCEHQGYSIEVINDSMYCVFDDGNKCNAMEFYRNECGAEYQKEFPCREIGEAVFHFEECCGGGYTHSPRFLIGQASCQPLSRVIIDGFRGNPFYWVGTLIVLGIIAYIIYKRKKKK